MDHKGFLTALFDFSFSEFITMKVIRVLYALAVVVSGIVALMMFVGGLMAMGSEPARGLLMIIITPIAFLLYVIGARIYLELIMVIFKIADNTSKMAGENGGQTPPAV